MSEQTTHTHPAPLDKRSARILGDIVDMYATSGQPVGSRALAELPRVRKLSPATIRNVMADLEAGGYLVSPHTSAGRVPTEIGFRYYTNNLVEVKILDSRLRKELESHIQPGGDVNETIKNASKILGQMTGYAGLVSTPRRENDALEKIEFLRLSNERVLAVMVTKGGHIENRVIEVPDKIDVATLNKSARHINTIINGQTLSDARVAMMETLTEQKVAVNSLMNQMMAAAETWGEAPTGDGALVVAGSQNLFQYPELVRDKLKGLIEAFEEKRLLMALMNEVQKGDGVQVFIGKDCPLEAAQECAMITAGYGNEKSEIIGTLGVIGPMRMDYKKTIGVVDYTAKLLGRALERVKDGE